MVFIILLLLFVSFLLNKIKCLLISLVRISTNFLYHFYVRLYIFTNSHSQRVLLSVKIITSLIKIYPSRSHVWKVLWSLGRFTSIVVISSGFDVLAGKTVQRLKGSVRIRIKFIRWWLRWRFIEWNQTSGYRILILLLLMYWLSTFFYF